MSTLYHAWFSIKQLQAGNMGTAKYRSVRGHTVVITEVTATDKPSGNFDDYVYLGQVDELVEGFPKLDLSKSFFRGRAVALLDKMKVENDRKEAHLFSQSFKSNSKFRLN